MLMKSGINPFDSQEAKPYKNDSEILAMTNLVSAYQVCLSCFIPCFFRLYDFYRKIVQI